MPSRLKFGNQRPDGGQRRRPRMADGDRASGSLRDRGRLAKLALGIRNVVFVVEKDVARRRRNAVRCGDCSPTDAGLVRESMKNKFPCLASTPMTSRITRGSASLCCLRGC